MRELKLTFSATGIFLVLLIGLGGQIWHTQAIVKFTNVQCSLFDKNYANFTKCGLNVIRRGVVALNIFVTFDHFVNNVTVNLELFKKVSGYRPFLYNVTTDFCLFMKNRKKALFLDVVLRFMLKNSNINHSCPYTGNIFVRDLVVEDSDLNKLPLPSGDYMFILRVATYNVWRGQVKVYITIIEN